ncbi:MAG: inner membrane protein [Methanolobus sp.]|uniref:metal-dependent hydrolase n=1 Tax=Methanolobus sp. TaxID=1874737 RepID=UPI0024AAFFF7|nr:metal-dependent hydrolase [Methanolobus sp.]MDI3486196.1 inner membrane protein [Methanolobus sp.]MDK2831018.1 inner membrane protein [Methanolobus sp.]
MGEDDRMVNTLSHLGIGLLIASVAGLNKRQIKIVAFMSILPDLDFILNVLFLAIDGHLNHQVYNVLYYMMGHREFMHSLIFALFVTLYIRYREKDRMLIIASGAAILSHIYLDYVTSWKMRPLFPFIKETSTIGAIDFFDPLITVISFIPLFYIMLGRVRANKNNSVFGNRNNSSSKVTSHIRSLLQVNGGWLNDISKGEHRSLYRKLLTIFVIWCVFNPLAKAVLVSDLEKTEGHEISYQDSYPISPGIFLSAYEFNETTYKILTSNYWSGVDKERFVDKCYCDQDSSATYIIRAQLLYNSSLPGEVDYPVYNVSTYDSNVTVVLSDARNPFAQYWAYFKTEYIFVFYTDSENYDVYLKRNVQYNKPLPVGMFE